MIGLTLKQQDYGSTQIGFELPSKHQCHFRLANGNVSASYDEKTDTLKFLRRIPIISFGNDEVMVDFLGNDAHD